MKTSSRKQLLIAWMFLSTVAMIAAASPYAIAQIILDPTGTVAGTIGLENESFGNGSIQHYTGSTWLYGTVNAVDGTYTLPVVADQPVSFYAYMYNFANTNSAYVRYYVYNQPGVAENATHTIDLKRPGGRISGSVTVNAGGTVERISMQSYGSNASVPENYYGSVASEPGVTPVIALQPFPVTTNAHAYGTVTIQLAAGCSITRSLTNKYFNVTANTTTDVNWTFDLTDVGCPTGSLKGHVALPNLLDTDAHLATTNGHRVWVSGGGVSQYIYLDADGPYAASSPLPTGPYTSQLYSTFQAPYGQTTFPYRNPAFTIVENETTYYDISYPVGTAHLSTDAVGTWSLNDAYYEYAQVITSGAEGSSSGYDSQYSPQGQFDYVMPVGTAYNNYQYLRFYSNLNGEYRNQYLYQYNYGADQPAGVVVAGQSVDLGTFTYAASQSLVTFQVADPNVLLKSIVLDGTAQFRDSDTNQLLSQSRITLNASNNTDQFETISVIVRGVSGKYAMTAIAYDVNGKAYSASFELNLGVSQNTPVGEDIPQELVGDDGSTVATLTFDNVTGEGTTTISEVGTGPNAPTNFAIFKNDGVNGNTGQFYYDIITTATFDGQVKICLNYDDSEMSAIQEANLELAHYADHWDIITEPYSDTTNPDTVNNVICGLTDSFSLFAGLVPLDSDNDNVLDNDDNCPDTPNTNQSDADNDGIGDACEPDGDHDGVSDDVDNCPVNANLDQADLDGDGLGDVCDPDMDNDGVANGEDICPRAADPAQKDFDEDGLGDACDPDGDGDGVENAPDECEYTPLGALIEPTSGCSSSQLFVLACPPDAEYKNHGQYVSCIAEEAEAQLDSGLLTEEEKDAVVSAAAKSDIGKK